MEKTYRSRISELKIAEKKKAVASRYMLITKLIFFASAVWLGYLSFQNINNLIYCIISLLIYIITYIFDYRCMQQIERLRSMRKICENEIAGLHGDFSPFKDGSEYINSGHPFSYDLDLFGPDSLFNRINRTVTRKGSDRLAKKLTVLSQNSSDILKNQKAILELAENLDWRIGFMARKRTENHLEEIIAKLPAVKSKSNFIKNVLPYISIGITLILLFISIFGNLSSTFFFLMFSLQLFSTVIIAPKTGMSIQHSENMHKEFNGYLEILKDIQNADFKSEVLAGLKSELFHTGADSSKAYRKLSQILDAFNQRGNIIMYVVMNGIFLSDLLLTRKFTHWLELYSPHIGIWMDCIAETDALTSLAGYAYNHPHNRFPEILDSGDQYLLKAENVYHTFLPEAKAVPNSFYLQKRKVAIITGANMAGKSTFLRTIGITYILATTGVPVCAERFSFSTVSLFSSMRTTDSLSKDISYFNAELLRLKQLLHYVKSHNFTLIILDEILKGTNSKDKLEGSVLFLHEISRYNISAVIATHDLELARLEEKEGNIYKNYCFEIELSNTINYTYKIQTGVAQNRNASYLLKNLIKADNTAIQ